MGPTTPMTPDDGKARGEEQEEDVIYTVSKGRIYRPLSRKRHCNPERVWRL